MMSFYNYICIFIEQGNYNVFQGAKKKSSLLIKGEFEINRSHVH